MNERLSKTVFLCSCSFAVGCVSSAAYGYWYGKKALKERTGAGPISWGLIREMRKDTPSVNLGLSMTDGDHNVEVLEQILEQSILPTLLSAQQMEWSPEVFEDNIRAQFHMMITIMTSLYEDGQKENLTLEEFKEKIKSEIKFIVMSAKEGTE